MEGEFRYLSWVHPIGFLVSTSRKETLLLQCHRILETTVHRSSSYGLWQNRYLIVLEMVCLHSVICLCYWAGAHWGQEPQLVHHCVSGSTRCYGQEAPAMFAALMREGIDWMGLKPKLCFQGVVCCMSLPIWQVCGTHTFFPVTFPGVIKVGSQGSLGRPNSGNFPSF